MPTSHAARTLPAVPRQTLSDRSGLWEAIIRDDRYSPFGIQEGERIVFTIETEPTSGTHVLAIIGTGAPEGLYYLEGGYLYDARGSRCRSFAPDITIIGRVVAVLPDECLWLF